MAIISNDDYDPMEKLNTLSANLEQPDKFADVFCNAAKTQKSIDNILKDIVRSLLKDDKETIDYLKIIQRQVHAEDFKSMVRKIGIGGWTLITVIITTMLNIFIKKYMS